jgi:hypothetical protein
MALTNEQFARKVLAMARPKGPFKPVATYDPDGDCLEFFARRDDFYAERVDDLVTVYYSQETHEVIGSLIKGVRAFYRQILKTYPGFGIEIKAGNVTLAHLFRARVWKMPPQKKPLVLTYRKLIKCAEEANVQARLPAGVN